jgi:hypothetical protein
MIDQFISRKLLDFNLEFVKKICAETLNNLDPNWNSNIDPFDDGILTVVWHLLGSKTRTPGRYTNPTVNTLDSVSNETVHFSVREKMEQTAKPNATLPLPPPSPALAGFEYDSDKRRWIYRKGKEVQHELPEFPLPIAEDKNSVQSWLCRDWLKSQET